MRTLWAVIGASLVVGICGAGVASVAAAGPVEDALSAALQESEAGRCDQAVSRLSKISGLASRALLLGGQCRIRQGDYPEALRDLDQARRSGGLRGTLAGDLELYRGVALYHLERYAEAGAALANADGVTTEHAQLALYRGLLALRSNDNERAAPSLESAARLSPSLTEPVASYYAGLAWQGASERTKARAAFQRVVEIDPDGPWGKEAAKLLESTELFPFFVRGSVGFEHDDNVRLRATGTDTVQGRSDKDWRGVWSLEGGVQLFQVGPWAGGVLASYFGSKHHNLDSFDVHFPTIGGFIDHRFDANTVARLRYDFGHAWVDRGSFLRTQSIRGSLAHTWERAGTTELISDVTWNDYRFENEDAPDGPSGGGPGATCVPALTNRGCGPFGLNETTERDRDGYGVGAALEHRYLLPIPAAIEEVLESASVRGGYRFEWYDSQGTEWERLGHILSAGFNVELPFDISLDAFGAWERYDYDNPSTFPTPRS